MAYVDDLRTHRIVTEDEAGWLQGSVDALLRAALHRYAEAGWTGEVIAESATEVHSLGDRIHGGLGRTELPEKFMQELPDMVLHAAEQPRLPYSQRAVVQGRVVRGALVERMLMSFLDEAWQWASASGAFQMSAGVFAELMGVVAMEVVVMAILVFLVTIIVVVVVDAVVIVVVIVVVVVFAIIVFVVVVVVALLVIVEESVAVVVVVVLVFVVVVG